MLRILNKIHEMLSRNCSRQIGEIQPPEIPAEKKPGNPGRWSVACQLSRGKCSSSLEGTWQQKIILSYLGRGWSQGELGGTPACRHNFKPENNGKREQETCPVDKYRDSRQII